MKQFKDILKAKRKEIEMKQYELARELGLTPQAICNLEQGSIPTFFTVDAIADYFECSVDELMGRKL